MKQTVRNYLGAALMLLALTGSNLINAQPPGGGQQGPPPIPNTKQIKEMVSDLADEISLSTEQEEDVLELYIEHFEEVEEQTSGNARPDRQEMEALKTKFESEVKALLSEEQQEQFTAYQKKNQQQRGGGKR